jgi:hypothetical protein
MKKLLLALGLCSLLSSSALAQGVIVGPGQQVLCTGIAGLPAGSTGLQQVVAASTGKSIFICGWHVTNTASSGTFAISYGTGSNCGTGTVTIVPAQNVNSTAPSADHIDYAVGSIPQSNALCLNFSVATIAGIIYYNQF